MDILLLALTLASPGWSQIRNDLYPVLDGEALQATRRYIPVPVIQLPQGLFFPAAAPALGLQSVIPTPTPVLVAAPKKVAQPIHVSVGVLLLEAAETEPALLDDENLMMLRIWQRTRMKDAVENGVVLEDVPKIPGFRERIRKELGL